MGKLTANIPDALHQKVRENVAAVEGMTTGIFIQQILEEHYSRLKGGMNMQKGTRTLALQIPEDLFQRVKTYLNENKLSQKEFVVGLIEKALMEWELSTKSDLSCSDPVCESESEHDQAGNIAFG